MDITLYAFQFSPHDGEEMFFNETLEGCRAEALQDRKMIRRDPDYDDLTPSPIYECVVRMDPATYARILSEPSQAVQYALISKKLIGLVVDKPSIKLQRGTEWYDYNNVSTLPEASYTRLLVSKRLVALVVD